MLNKSRSTIYRHKGDACIYVISWLLGPECLGLGCLTTHTPYKSAITIHKSWPKKFQCPSCSPLNMWIS